MRNVPTPQDATRTPPKPRHLWLFALPGATMPARITCNGHAYTLEHTFKHDFFAATGLYRGPDDERVVLKMGRTTPVGFLPLRWAGRFLAGREVRMYERVADLPGVPALVGRVEDTGFLHEFVPGRPLGRRDEVNDAFFPTLQALLDTLHARDVAYVDLNKRQNILLGEDGRPYLIDFQISLWLPRRGWRGTWPAQWLLRRFQHADRYHTLKHKRRLRPDQLTAEEARSVARISIWIRLHRLVARPLTHLRRWVLHKLQSGEKAKVAGSDAK